MPSQFAAYYNATEGGKASQQQSRRASSSSADEQAQQPTSNTSSRRSSIKSFFDNFKLVEQPQTATGYQTRVIVNAPLFTSHKSAEYKKMSRWERNAAVAALLH
jgi:hypothetical protein